MADRYVPKGTTNVSGTVTVNAADNLIFNEGGQEITSGVDFSAIAAIANVYVGSSCTASIASSTIFKCGISGSFIYAAGGGTWRLMGDDSGTNTIAKLTHVGNGKMVAMSGGTITSWEQGSGTGYIASDIAVTSIYMNGGRLDQLYSASANTNWWIEEATFFSGRGFSGTAIINGGAEVTVRREDTSATLPTGGTMYVNSGMVKWCGGNCTNFYVGSSGSLDLSDAPNAITANVYGTSKGLARSKLVGKYATHVLTVTGYVSDKNALFSLGEFPDY